MGLVAWTKSQAQPTAIGDVERASMLCLRFLKNTTGPLTLVDPK